MVNPIEAEQALRHRVGINLRALRQSAGLTLRKAAELAEIHWRHLQKIEAGEINITLYTLVRLACALHADAAALLGHRWQPVN